MVISQEKLLILGAAQICLDLEILTLDFRPPTTADIIDIADDDLISISTSATIQDSEGMFGNVRSRHMKLSAHSSPLQNNEDNLRYDCRKSRSTFGNQGMPGGRLSRRVVPVAGRMVGMT